MGSDSATAAGDDLGFVARIRKSGDVEVRRDGTIVTIVGGQAATALAALLRTEPFAAQQQALARATGNYRRGNERKAKQHPRNRT